MAGLKEILKAAGEKNRGFRPFAKKPTRKDKQNAQRVKSIAGQRLK
tara:strand:+ start:1063 stop:1200 length:138 start_codon:yes stop_codon:yes gene_type:complete